MKKLTALALMGALLSFTHNSFAADGTITFRGKIVDQTCAVDTGSKSLTVTLPTVSKSVLDQNGKTTGETPFTVSLTGCKVANQATGSTVRLHFVNSSAIDATRGILNNSTGGGKATNVGIQILDSTATNPIPLGKPIAEYNQVTDKVALSQNVALNYQARYYATGAATAGDVQAQVQFNVVYD